jgi:hypothetical protein
VTNSSSPDVAEILAKFVLTKHTSVADFIERADPWFILCFDSEGGDVSVDDVAKVSPSESSHGRDVFTPVPGVGHYAHLTRAGESVSMNGASTRYVFKGPDWTATVHVTEPSTGGDPDAVADPFEISEGARRFAEALEDRLRP